MNVPKLRFKEFNNSWNQELLCDNGEFKNGVNKSKEDFESGYPFVNLMDVFGKTIINENKNLDLVKVNNNELKEFNLLKNDILFVRSSVKLEGVGLTTLIEKNLENTVYSGFLIRYRRKKENINFYYLNYYFYSPYFRKELIKRSAKSANVNINQDNLSLLKIYYPEPKEQKKIADFLYLLDKKIELQSKKIEALKLYKKGLFFEIKDLNCENDIKLKNLVKFENGKGHESIVSEDGYFILINSKFISTNGNVIKKCTMQLTPLIKNDIVMVMSDLPNGKALAKCFFVDENDKYSLNQRICSLRVNSNVNAKYIFYKINRNPFYLKFDDKVNQTNLKKDDVLKLTLPIPDLETQNKVATIMSIIDEKIANENLILLNLKKLKKGLMQNMFV